MQTIPEYISVQFNNILRQRVIPESFHVYYRKWLRYFLDFSQKYSLPESKSEQVRLFIEKLKSKHQSQQQCSQAAHAISLFFESQRTKDSLPLQAVKKNKIEGTPASAPLKVQIKNDEAGGIKPQGMSATAIAEPGPTFCSSGGKQYNEWRCLGKTKSPAWDQAIEKLAVEIKVRHYSRKTLKKYADWARKFQRFLKEKPP
jgi:hypothetical protein